MTWWYESHHLDNRPQVWMQTIGSSWAYKHMQEPCHQQLYQRPFEQKRPSLSIIWPKEHWDDQTGSKIEKKNTKWEKQNLKNTLFSIQPLLSLTKFQKYIITADKKFYQGKKKKLKP